MFVYILDKEGKYTQGEESLEDLRIRLEKFWDPQKVRSYISKLVVYKSKRAYNNLNRTLPGATFLYKGKPYILTGQQNKGKTLISGKNDKDKPQMFGSGKCKVIYKNTGLVYLA